MKEDFESKVAFYKQQFENHKRSRDTEIYLVYKDEFKPSFEKAGDYIFFAFSQGNEQSMRTAKAFIEEEQQKIKGYYAVSDAFIQYHHDPKPFNVLIIQLVTTDGKSKSVIFPYERQDDKIIWKPEFKHTPEDEPRSMNFFLKN